MSQVNRRDFIKKSSIVAGTAAMGGLIQACSKSEKPVASWNGFKHAMCNESMQDLSWSEQCSIVANAGYQGIEIAPFTLVQNGVSDIDENGRKEMKKVMNDLGLECAGLHWLLAPPPKGLHFTTPDAKLRAKTVDYLNQLIDFCGDLGGTAMIFGSPKQRNTLGISIDEAKKYFTENLASVADHAQARGVKILIEPLDTSQTDVINVTAEAVEIINKINHPAIQTMFDFHNTPNETEPFDVIVEKNYQYIKHVHVQEMDGKYLGTGDSVDTFVKAFQVLKNKNYDKWVSLEVFDFTPGGKTIAESSIKVLKEIESKLV